MATGWLMNWKGEILSFVCVDYYFILFYNIYYGQSAQRSQSKCSLSLMMAVFLGNLQETPNIPWSWDMTDTSKNLRIRDIMPISWLHLVYLSSQVFSEHKIWGIIWYHFVFFFLCIFRKCVYKKIKSK